MCSDFLKNLVFNRRAHVASNVTVVFLGPEFTIIYVIYYYCGENNAIKMLRKYFFGDETTYVRSSWMIEA